MTGWMIRFLPALRVNSWGGFGSQLFTAHMILRVQQLYPSRRIKVVIHTSGVTRRIPEFNFEKLGVKMIQVDDFKRAVMANQVFGSSTFSILRLKEVAKRCLWLFLIWTRFLQMGNTEQTFNSMRWWTLSFRGHYSKLKFDESALGSLHKIIFDAHYINLKHKYFLVIHYRLGDLLNLAEKEPIDPERVGKLVLYFRENFKQAIILTDSSLIDLASYLENSKELKFLNTANYNPVETLKLCISADEFVGTNSKLSIWAMAFRAHIYQKRSYLPEEIREALIGNLRTAWY